MKTVFLTFWRIKFPPFLFTCVEKGASTHKIYFNRYQYFSVIEKTTLQRQISHLQQIFLNNSYLFIAHICVNEVFDAIHVHWDIKSTTVQIPRMIRFLLQELPATAELISDAYFLDQLGKKKPSKKKQKKNPPNKTKPTETQECLCRIFITCVTAGHSGSVL